MTDTPRTDALDNALQLRGPGGGSGYAQWRDFARTLERELAAAMKKLYEAGCVQNDLSKTIVARDAYAVTLADLLRRCAPMVSLKLCVEITDALKNNPNEFQTRQQGSNSDLPGSVRTEMGAVGPASECKEVIAARERLEPEGVRGNSRDAQNDVTVGETATHSFQDSVGGEEPK